MSLKPPDTQGFIVTNDDLLKEARATVSQMNTKQKNFLDCF